MKANEGIIVTRPRMNDKLVSLDLFPVIDNKADKGVTTPRVRRLILTN